MTEDAVFELLILECRVGTDGTVRYYNALGQRHRVYGPAVEYADGHREWYQNDLLHRLDGPAVEWADGCRAWFQNGLLHSHDGPAIERPSWIRACISTSKNWLSLKWVRKWLTRRLYD